jgi:hypothetical protein
MISNDFNVCWTIGQWVNGRVSRESFASPLVNSEIEDIDRMAADHREGIDVPTHYSAAGRLSMASRAGHQ